MRRIFTAGLFAIAAVLLAGQAFGFSPQAWRIAADLALTLVAVLSTVWAVVYGLQSSWRSNRVGRVVFVGAVLVSAVLWQAVWHTWARVPYPGQDVIRFVVCAFGAVGFAATLSEFLRSLKTSSGRVTPGPRL